MKIKIIEPCMTPAGSHQPGETIETETRFADYLIANGYAKPAGKADKENAASPLADVESATMETAATARPKRK